MSEDKVILEYIMLVGFPGSGKSTYIKQLMAEFPEKDYVVCSTDDLITAWGEAEGLNYTQAIQKFGTKKSDKAFKIQIKQALNTRRNIIIDRTNLSPNARRKMLSQVPAEYKKMAFVFEVAPEELARRLEKRANETGKVIPERVMAQMKTYYQPPSRSEFDEIKYV